MIGYARYVGENKDIQMVTKSSYTLECSVSEAGATSQDEAMYTRSMEHHSIDGFVGNVASS